MNDRVQNTLTDPGIVATIRDQHETGVALSLKIEADSKRVLNAVSIPEYVETWLLAPDAKDVQFVFKFVGQDTFCIDLYRAEGLQASIHGSCRIVSANRIRYTWKTTSPVGSAETLVEMQLLRIPGACILDLKHCGFQDTAERAWFCKMWCRSLERLCRLIGKNSDRPVITHS